MNFINDCELSSNIKNSSWERSFNDNQFLNILILNDDKNVFEKYKNIYQSNNVVHCSTYFDFINKIQMNNWDIIHLDFDLSSFEYSDCYINSSEELIFYNGFDAAKKLIDLNIKPKQIIIDGESNNSKEIFDILNKNKYNVFMENNENCNVDIESIDFF